MGRARGVQKRWELCDYAPLPYSALSSIQLYMPWNDEIVPTGFSRAAGINVGSVLLPLKSRPVPLGSGKGHSGAQRSQAGH